MILTSLETLGLFLVIFFVLVLISQFRDWPGGELRKKDYRDHDWLAKERREVLQQAAAPRLYRHTTTGYRMPKDEAE